MSQKKVFIFVYHDMARVGVFSDKYVKDVLSERKYSSLKEYYAKDRDGFIEDIISNDNSTCYFEKVNGVKVIEGKMLDTRPFDLMHEVFDKTPDINHLVRFKISRARIPNKGLAYKQVSCWLGDCAEMVVDKSFVFDPSKLTITGPGSMKYDGTPCNFLYSAGDDNGDYVFYYDGVVME